MALYLNADVYTLRLLIGGVGNGPASYAWRSWVLFPQSENVCVVVFFSKYLDVFLFNIISISMYYMYIRQASIGKNADVFLKFMSMLSILIASDAFTGL